ncbi:phage tail protein [Aquibacillus saliphilus]|uniref:phage tail protein n=1 Tax=Aquibacillus saliphilus TaxID=1909422 RepID=UPI001CEFBCFC|nr:phage tail protein [Aquibacillus saliphilus]
MTTWDSLTSQTLESSYWLSDNLSHALINYNGLVQSKQSEYDSLITQRTQLLTDMSNKNSEIFNVETELATTRDIIDVKQSQGLDASTELGQESDLEIQLSTLNNEKDTIQSDLDANLASLNDITTLLSFENNFTQLQIDELAPFRNTAIWENSNIATVDDLLTASKEYFSTINYPKTDLRISLVDLLKIADVPDNVKNLTIGDKINIYYEVFDISVQSQIIEMDLDYENGGISLVIANTHDVIANPDEEMFDQIYKNVSVAGAVLREKYKWDKVTGVENTIMDYINSSFDAAQQEITSGVNESVTVNRRGITIKDSDDPNRFIRMTNSVIGLIKDGKNLGVAISPDGIVADYLYGKIIAGANLAIENESGTYTIDDDGFVITRTDGLVKTVLDSNSGIKIQKKEGNNWIDQLYFDTDGNGIYRGSITSDDGQGNKVEINSGTMTTTENNETVARLANYKLELFDSPKDNPNYIGGIVGRLATVWGESTNSDRGISLVGSADYVTIGKDVVGDSTSKRWMMFDFIDRKTTLAGGDNTSDSGELLLSSTWSGGTADGKVSSISARNYTDNNSVAWSNLMFYTGRDNRSPGGSNERFGFEVWQYRGTGDGSNKQMLKIDTDSSGKAFTGIYTDKAYLPYDTKIQAGNVSQKYFQGVGMSMSSSLESIKGALNYNAVMYYHYWDLTVGTGSYTFGYGDFSFSGAENIFHVQGQAVGTDASCVTVSVDNMSSTGFRMYVRGTGAKDISNQTFRVHFIVTYEPN